MSEEYYVKSDQAPLAFNAQEKTVIRFFTSPSHEPVIKITKDGLYYRGEFVPDAGEVHRLMVNFLQGQGR